MWGSVSFFMGLCNLIWSIKYERAWTMSLPRGRLQEPDFLLIAVVVMEAHVKKKPLSPWVLESLSSAEPSYGPMTLLLCYTPQILKLFVGVEKPGLS